MTLLSKELVAIARLRDYAMRLRGIGDAMPTAEICATLVPLVEDLENIYDARREREVADRKDRPRPLRDGRERAEWLRCLHTAAVILDADVPDKESQLLPEYKKLLCKTLEEYADELHARFRARCARGLRCNPCKGTGRIEAEGAPSRVCPACHGEGCAP